MNSPGYNYNFILYLCFPIKLRNSILVLSSSLNTPCIALVSILAFAFLIPLIAIQR